MNWMVAFLSSSCMSDPEKVNSWDEEGSLLRDLDMFDKWTKSNNLSLIGTRQIPPHGIYIPINTCPPYWSGFTCSYKFGRFWTKVTIAVWTWVSSVSLQTGLASSVWNVAPLSPPPFMLIQHKLDCQTPFKSPINSFFITTSLSTPMPVEFNILSFGLPLYPADVYEHIKAISSFYKKVWWVKQWQRCWLSTLTSACLTFLSTERVIIIPTL